MTAVLFLIVIAGIAEASWRIDVAGGRNIQDVSLAVDSAGVVHAAYGGQTLQYARFEAGVWTSEVLSMVASGGAYDASIALDSAGRPGISYDADLPGDLGFVRWDGTRWRNQLVDVDGDVGNSSSLAFDASDNPVISYQDSDARLLKLARFDGTTWILELVDTDGPNGYRSSVAVDPSGDVVIAYEAYTFAGLRFARWDGTAWSLEDVDATATTWNPSPSMALDSAGRPGVAYLANDGLRLARWDGAAWLIDSLYATAGNTPKLAYDAADRPSILHAENPFRVVHLTRHDGTGWTHEQVASEGISLGFTLDATGAPFPMFASRGELLHATFDGTAWSNALVDQDIEAADFTSIDFDSADRPIVSFLDYERYDLWASFGDSLGGWAPELVDNRSSVGEGASLVVDDLDQVHITYFNTEDDGLELATYDGSSWSLSTIDPLVEYCEDYATVDFDPVTGVLAVSYLDDADSGLHYASFDGTAWRNEVIDPSGDINPHTALAFDPAGRPAMTYHNSDFYGIQISRFTGSTWATQWVAIEATETSCLAFDAAGNPAVGFQDYDDENMRFAQWTPFGWVEEIVDAREQTGTYCSLEFDPSGVPVLTYFDDDLYTIRLARRPGTRWVREVVDANVEAFDRSSMSLNSSGHPAVAILDDDEYILKVAHRTDWAYRIWRGESPLTMVEIADVELGWTDLDTPSGGIFFYRADSLEELLLVKDGRDGRLVYD